MSVNPATGDREILSSLDRGAGSRFAGPEDLTIDSNGDILVADAAWRAIFRVDPTTGDRELLSTSDVLGVVGAGPGFADLRTIAVASFRFPVGIDIRPRNPANRINLSSQGVVRVALLGTADFEVAEVEAETLAFGPAGATLANRRGPHFEDVNDDGFTDLVGHFRVQEAGIALGDGEACLVGETSDESRFEGCDAIWTLGPCGIGFELAVLPLPLIWLRRRCAGARRPIDRRGMR
jgi:hypothetical protein